MEKYLGKWAVESTENFDEYLKVMGAGFMLRKVASTLKPDVDIVDNGDGSYSIVVTSTFKNVTNTFKLGEEFEETLMDGRKVQSTIVIDENGVMVHTQKTQPPNKVTRRLEGDKMYMDMVAGGVTAKRIMKRA